MRPEVGRRRRRKRRGEAASGRGEWRGEAKPGEAWRGEARRGDAEAEAEARPGQARKSEGRRGEVRRGKGKRGKPLAVASCSLGQEQEGLRREVRLGTGDWDLGTGEVRRSVKPMQRMWGEKVRKLPLLQIDTQKCSGSLGGSWRPNCRCYK